MLFICCLARIGGRLCMFFLSYSSPSFFNTLRFPLSRSISSFHLRSLVPPCHVAFIMSPVPIVHCSQTKRRLTPRDQQKNHNHRTIPRHNPHPRPILLLRHRLLRRQAEPLPFLILGPRPRNRSSTPGSRSLPRPRRRTSALAGRVGR